MCILNILSIKNSASYRVKSPMTRAITRLIPSSLIMHAVKSYFLKFILLCIQSITDGNTLHRHILTYILSNFPLSSETIIHNKSENIKNPVIIELSSRSNILLLKAVWKSNRALPILLRRVKVKELGILKTTGYKTV